MTRRRRHGLAALAVALVAAIAAHRRAGRSAGRRRRKRLRATRSSRQLSRSISRSIPGNGGEPNEGPGSYEEQQFAALAYPAADIPQAALAGARIGSGLEEGQVRHAARDRRASGCPSARPRRSIPSTELRNSFSYVPNAYVAGGRTTVLAIAPTCKPGRLPALDGAAGGGIWRPRTRSNGQPELGLPRPARFGIQRGGLDHRRPERPVGRHGLGRHGRGERLRRLRGRRRRLQDDERRRDVDGPARSKRLQLPRRRDRSRSCRATRTRSTRRRRAPCAASSSVLPAAASRSSRARRSGGSTSRPNGGASWTFIHNGAATTGRVHGRHDRGDERRALLAARRAPHRARPAEPEHRLRGLVRPRRLEVDRRGSTWTQIHAALVSTPAVTTSRPEIAVNVKNGKTRMYVAEGASGAPTARVFRTDDAQTGDAASGWVDLTSSSPADPGYGTFAYCTGQCWYDNFVYTPKGIPDIVYVGGSYSYDETGISNGRGVVLSTRRRRDVERHDDGRDRLPASERPASRPALPRHEPGEPAAVLRVERRRDHALERRATPTRRSSALRAGSRGTTLARCQQLLSSVPTELESMNKGYPTLQFQSLSVSPFNSEPAAGRHAGQRHLADPGQPDEVGEHDDRGRRPVRLRRLRPVVPVPHVLRASPDVNFSNGDIADWNWIGDPLSQPEAQSFYIADHQRPGRVRLRCSSARATCGGRRRTAWAR